MNKSVVCFFIWDLCNTLSLMAIRSQPQINPVCCWQLHCEQPGLVLNLAQNVHFMISGIPHPPWEPWTKAWRRDSRLCCVWVCLPLASALWLAVSLRSVSQSSSSASVTEIRSPQTKADPFQERVDGQAWQSNVLLEGLGEDALQHTKKAKRIQPAFRHWKPILHDVTINMMGYLK